MNEYQHNANVVLKIKNVLLLVFRNYLYKKFIIILEFALRTLNETTGNACWTITQPFLLVFSIYKLFAVESVSDIFYTTMQETQACQGLGEALISSVKGGCIQTVSRLLQQGAPLDVEDFVSHRFLQTTKCSKLINSNISV